MMGKLIKGEGIEKNRSGNYSSLENKEGKLFKGEYYSRKYDNLSNYFKI